MGDDLQGASVFAAIGLLVGMGIGLAVDLGLLAIALGPVRRHRPDVSGLLATAAVVLAVLSVVSPFLYAASSTMVASMGTSAAGLVRMNTVLGLALTAVRAGALAMVLAAIARLATPSRHDPREPT